MNSTSHNHADDDLKVQASKVKATMKDHATATRGKPSQILADTAVAVPVEVRAAFGDTESVKCTIRRYKRGALPKEPASLREMGVDDSWGQFEGQDFLLHDSGQEAANRVLVFGTAEGLRHLGRSSQWFMDGTFASAPILFKQLYVIRAPLGETTVACVYAFCQVNPSASMKNFSVLLPTKVKSWDLILIPKLLYPPEASGGYFGLASATPPPRVERFSALTL